jgi:hypothetical protein
LIDGTENRARFVSNNINKKHILFCPAIFFVTILFKNNNHEIPGRRVISDRQFRNGGGGTYSTVDVLNTVIQTVMYV